MYSVKGARLLSFLGIDGSIPKLYNYQIFIRRRPYREPRIQITVANREAQKGVQIMTVVTTTATSRMGGSSLAEKHWDRVESVTPFRHVAITAATLAVSQFRVEDEPLVRAFPIANCQLHHLIADVIVDAFAASEVWGMDLVIAFPADPGSAIDKAIRGFELEDKLIFPGCAGIGVTRLENRAVVRRFGESLRPEHAVIHRQFRIPG